MVQPPVVFSPECFSISQDPLLESPGGSERDDQQELEPFDTFITMSDLELDDRCRQSFSDAHPAKHFNKHEGM